MAAPKKQRRLAQREENSSDSENNTENENNQEMEIIEVDFDVKFPESSDRQGIKNLLQQLFLKAHINISELADLLIEQSNITGVIKEAEEEDMEVEDDEAVSFGVFSIVNLTAKKNMECIKQICTYLLNHCKAATSNDSFESFQKIIEDSSKHVGLIISERFSNIPAKIAVPLYAGLSNDMSTAREKKEAYDFAYYLLISKMVIFNSGTATESTSYANPEEELIEEEATFKFDFKVERDLGLGGTWTEDDEEGLPLRRIFLLPATKWDSMYKKLIEEIGPA